MSEFVSRPLGLVLDAILAQVPVDYDRYDELKQTFSEIKKDIPYTAPEAMHIRWDLAMEALQEYIPLSENMAPWKQTVVDIFSSKIDYTNAEK
jgi:hypothetical protein